MNLRILHHSTVSAVAFTAFIWLSSSLPAAAAQSKATTPRPVIEDQPVGRAATEGGPLALSVNAGAASDLAYQWWKGGVLVTNSARLSGATNAVLSIDPVALTDAGDYAVVVSNSGGAVTSAVAKVTTAQILFGVSFLGTTGAVINVLGQVGEVYRVEAREGLFGNWRTNGYTTNVSGTTRFFTPITGSEGAFRARYEKLLPVMYSSQSTNAHPLIRIYGKLNDAWRIENSSDLRSWSPLVTVTNTAGWIRHIDTTATGPNHFYRVTLP